MNIAIVRAFVEMKKQLSQYSKLAKKMQDFEYLTNSQFIEVYEALENLINDTQKLKELSQQKKDRENRESIGFKK